MIDYTVVCDKCEKPLKNIDAIKTNVYWGSPIASSHLCEDCTKLLKEWFGFGVE